MLPDGFRSKSLFCFVTTYFQLQKKSLQNTNYISHIKAQSTIYIWTYYSFSFRSQLYHLSYVTLTICIRNGKSNIFSSPRHNSWNGMFTTGSLYECASSQKLSVLLVSQASMFSWLWGSKTPVLHGMKNINTFLRNLKAFSSSLLFFCMGSCLGFNFFWNPWLLLKF